MVQVTEEAEVFGEPTVKCIGVNHGKKSLFKLIENTQVVLRVYIVYRWVFSLDVYRRVMSILD